MHTYLCCSVGVLTVNSFVRELPSVSLEIGSMYCI